MHEENIIERRNSKKGQAHNGPLAAINTIECGFENTESRQQTYYDRTAIFYASKNDR